MAHLVLGRKISSGWAGRRSRADRVYLVHPLHLQIVDFAGKDIELDIDGIHVTLTGHTYRIQHTIHRRAKQITDAISAGGSLASHLLASLTQILLSLRPAVNQPIHGSLNGIAHFSHGAESGQENAPRHVVACISGRCIDVASCRCAEIFRLDSALVHLSPHDGELNRFYQSSGSGKYLLTSSS